MAPRDTPPHGRQDGCQVRDAQSDASPAAPWILGTGPRKRGIHGRETYSSLPTSSTRPPLIRLPGPVPGVHGAARSASTWASERALSSDAQSVPSPAAPLGPRHKAEETEDL